MNNIEAWDFVKAHRSLRNGTHCVRGGKLIWTNTYEKGNAYEVKNTLTKRFPEAEVTITSDRSRSATRTVRLVLEELNGSQDGGDLGR